MLEEDDLDTGEELPINALLELTNKSPTNSAPPNRHLSSLHGRHAFDFRALGIVLYDLGFVSCLLPPECAEDMPAPKHAASHPITVSNARNSFQGSLRGTVYVSLINAKVDCH